MDNYLITAEVAERLAEVLRADPEPSMDNYLITAEVAAMTRTPPETVRYWRHKGTGPKSFKVGRRVLYARDDVVAWIEEQKKGR